MVKKKKLPPDPDETFIPDFSKHFNSFQTIKIPLKKIIKDPETHNKINDLIILCNHIVMDTYLFIRLYALYKYNNNKEIPKLNETFISYCIMTLGKRSNAGRKAENNELLYELTDFYDTEFQPIYRHNKHNIVGLTYTTPYIKKTIKTCITTNLKEHYLKRLFRFINIVGGKYYDEKYEGERTNEKEYNEEKKEYLWKLKTYILNDTNKDKQDKKKEKANTENKTIKKPEEVLEFPVFMKEWYFRYKNFIIPTIKTSIPYDCEADPYKFLQPCFYMNEQYEMLNEITKEKILQKQNSITEENKEQINKEIKELNKTIIKLFQPLSLRNSNIPKYITIDTATLSNLFSKKGEKAKNNKNITENQMDIWETHFRLNKKIFGFSTNKKKQPEYLFNFTLQTDGVGCSLLFKHRTMEDKVYGSKVEQYERPPIPYIDELNDYQNEVLKTKKIITADPGKLYLLYMMDDEGNELKYSCKQRDTETLAKRNRRIMLSNKKRNKINSDLLKQENIIESETELSNYCCKTSNYEKFKDFIRVKQEVNIKTRHFYEQKLYRKLNWRKKTYRQKSEDKLMNNIEKSFGSPEDIVICIGDWSNKNTIKGLGSTMGIGLKRLIQKKYITLLLDEYNTSKKCCNCWNNVENVCINEKSQFRLLECKYCKESNTGSPEDEKNPVFQSRKYLTRDKNSCINMLSIAKHIIYKKERPLEFQRTKKLPLPL
jgi:hypothetical protein